MTKKEQRNAVDKTSRRDFIKKGSSLLVAGGVVAGSLSIARSAHSFGSDQMKVGLIGCGGRGAGAATQAMNTMKKEDIKPNGPVKLVAMGDVFADRLQQAYRAIKSEHTDSVDVSEDHKFVGVDAYKRVLESDIDLVILATPPGFRPLHLEAAINAGKHVFAEKPLATDAPGVRRVLAATEAAKEKGLSLTVGLQRHHEQRYIETIQRIWDGAIGDVLFTRVYWNGGGVWTRPRQANQSELEYQMRNWYYFNWLCGDHICEQHIHNLDVGNWVMKGYPVECQGMGGREVRKGKDNGEIYDHHSIEYTYANGAKMFSQCRHIEGCWNAVTEYAHGTKGWAQLDGTIYNLANEIVWSSGKGGGNGHQEEHFDLFAALRRGDVPNEGEYGAKSTMTSILGRHATYSGKVVKWDEAINSDTALADFDAITSMDDKAPVQPDANGNYAIPIPGKTKVV